MNGWDKAAEHAAGATYADWERLLLENPKVLWGLIADVVKAVKAAEGERRTGRRPAATVGSLDELYELLFPATYMINDFPSALSMALGERSQRDLAREAHISQAVICRLATGQKKPSVRDMEMLAAALNVRPTYFREYRAARIGQLVTQILTEYPHMSADAIRNLEVARR